MRGNLWENHGNSHRNPPPNSKCGKTHHATRDMLIARAPMQTVQKFHKIPGNFTFMRSQSPLAPSRLPARAGFVHQSPESHPSRCGGSMKNQCGAVRMKSLKACRHENLVPL